MSRKIAFNFKITTLDKQCNPTQIRDREHRPGDGRGSEAQQGGHAHVGARHRQGQGEDDRGSRKQGAEEQVQQVQRFHRNAGC